MEGHASAHVKIFGTDNIIFFFLILLQDEGCDRPVCGCGGRVRDGGDQRGGARQARQLQEEARQAQAASQETGEI